uniref:Secreted protein n=1 Tax=Pipistrellus kuhlii TaxID=59472 RepID=A0A7J7V0J6_PIPKU|nr:hypothetical protein mPipKuh1_008662 [Pipistrellus kuhlii]
MGFSVFLLVFPVSTCHHPWSSPYYWLYSLSWTLHPHDSSVSADLYLSVPSPVSASPPNPLPFVNHWSVLCIYDSTGPCFRLMNKSASFRKTLPAPRNEVLRLATRLCSWQLTCLFLLTPTLPGASWVVEEAQKLSFN